MSRNRNQRKLKKKKINQNGRYTGMKIPNNRGDENEL